MTDEQRNKIAALRSSGVSYGKIAEALNLPQSTVKTYCRRNNLLPGKAASEETAILCTCRACGKPLVQAAGRKPRAFCSRECREKWWHTHPELLHQKALYSFVCAGCGKPFSAYGNNHRKYCSHACYIQTRFRGGRHE